MEAPYYILLTLLMRSGDITHPSSCTACRGQLVDFEGEPLLRDILCGRCEFCSNDT